MAKENKIVKINCENEMVARALMGYFTAHQHSITKSLDNALRSNGAGLTDVTFQDMDYTKFKMNLVINPTDKGDVFIIDKESKELSVLPYTDLDDEEPYGIVEGGLTMIFQHKKDEVDRALGQADSIAQLTYNLQELPRLLEEEKKKQLPEVAHAEESNEDVESKKEQEVDA